jgi:two-component system, NtrC family, C4-dicarboxylate transport response regulator DctD
MDHRHRVIVVDDDANVRRLFSDALEAVGVAVHATATAEQAVQLVRDTPETCVVLADVRMPHMDGWDLERALRRLAPDMPVVLVTSDRLLSIRGGPVRDKPVSPADIEALVRTSCRLNQPVR